MPVWDYTDKAGKSVPITADNIDDAMRQVRKLTAAPEPMGTGEDIALSSVAGLGHGAADVVAMPRTLADLLGGGAAVAADYLKANWTGKGDAEFGRDFSKVRAREEARRAKEGYYTSTHVLPSAEDVNQFTTEKTGWEAHKPQTEWGKAAHNVASFIPGAVATGPGGIVRGGGRILSNALAYGVVPGVASEGSARLAKGMLGDAAEAPARFVGGLLGAGAGGLAQRPTSAKAALKEADLKGLTKEHIDDASSLIQKADQNGVNLTWPEAIKQVTNNRVDVTNLQRQLESLSGSRGVMTNYLGERPAQIEGMVGREVPKQFGGPIKDSTQAGLNASEVAAERLHRINELINVKTAPLMQASGRTKVDAAQLARLRADDAFIQLEQQLQNTPLLMRNIRAGKYQPDEVGWLNEIKQLADTAGINLAKGENKNLAMSSSAKNLAQDIRTVGTNADARYGDFLRVQDELRAKALTPRKAGPLGTVAGSKANIGRMGKSFLPSQAELPQGFTGNVTDAVRVMGGAGPAGEKAVRDIVQNRIMNIFNKSMKGASGNPDEWGGAKFVSNLLGGPETRKHAEAVIRALPEGDTIWNGLNQLIPILEATGKRMKPGSPAGQNIRTMKELASGTVAGGPSTGPGSLFVPFANAVKELWGSRRLRNNAEGLAKIITSPQAAGIFRELIDGSQLDRARQVLNIMHIIQQSGGEKPVTEAVLPPKDSRDVYGRP